MVACTTPTTVKAGSVSTVLEAGYHVELAGGGHYSQATLHAKVAEIRDFPRHRFDAKLALHQSAPILLPAPSMAGDVP